MEFFIAFFFTVISVFLLIYAACYSFEESDIGLKGVLIGLSLAVCVFWTVILWGRLYDNTNDEFEEVKENIDMNTRELELIGPEIDEINLLDKIGKTMDDGFVLYDIDKTDDSVILKYKGK